MSEIMRTINKQKLYSLFICLTLISFGFFGSLSHVFSLALIILTFFRYKLSEKKSEVEFKPKIVFLALSGVFFCFF